MELLTINQVSKEYDISPRMLRYYEQIGLIYSIRNETNSYRAYDADALKCIQQIIILRKLQIPVKQIHTIIKSPKAAVVIEIFKENLSRLEKELYAYTTIKSILENFLHELEEIVDVDFSLNVLDEVSLQKLVQSFPLLKKNKNIKEKFIMSDLNQAAETLHRLKDIRVVYLPPMTVVSAFYKGENQEERAWQAITDFVKQSDLLKIKPDLRLFQIDHCNATGRNYGYEMWLSIPDDLKVLAPLTKKRFHGGLYAAHSLGENGDEVILGLQDWINESDKYQFDYDGNLTRCEPPLEEIDGQSGTWVDVLGGKWLDLQEVLNFYHFQEPSFEKQIDYLFPIKSYVQLDNTPVEITGSKEKCGYKASIVTKSKFRVMGFSKVMTQGSDNDTFIRELKSDGTLDILNKFRKPGTALLKFASMDMDSQIRGGSRITYCLAESDITDIQAFMEYEPYIRTIDAAKWLIFEYTKGDAFASHSTCIKLGYTWNGVISGSFTAYMDGEIDKPNEDNEEEMKSVIYSWYPVK